MGLYEAVCIAGCPVWVKLIMIIISTTVIYQCYVLVDS